MTEPSLHGVLDSPLGTLACSGRKVTWMAVRRRYNRAADQAATEGCMAAAKAAVEGRLNPFVTVQVHEQ
eukprot:6507427-Lingulodinium_polyedra.AAC.1